MPAAKGLTSITANPSLILTGPWQAARDPNNHGREDRWFAAIRREAESAPVPGIIQQVFPDYHGVVWYWTTFRLPRAAAAGERVLLRFGMVDYLAEVWVNGVPAGGHEGGETPFSLDITQAVNPDSEQLLAVRILNPADTPIDGFLLKDTPHRHKCTASHYMPGRCYNTGGIYLPVELAIVPAIRVDDLFAHADPQTGHILLTVTVHNATARSVAGRLAADAGPASSGDMLASALLDATFAPGNSVHTLALSITQPHLWSLADPFLYRAQVTLAIRSGEGATSVHQQAIRWGFRDFRVIDGFFHLNGRRLFLRSTHTGNHFPIGQIVPMDPDFMRRDLLYAKACGFNMVRFIAGMAYPEQLDYCDEIGLMVYEESLAGWELADSPHMAERYDRSIREMVLRDRNHPCVTIWGLLNETGDNPVFRHAVDALPLVRELDDTRLVLLGSGRWDCDWGIGSVSNPGSRVWEHQWGGEAPGMPRQQFVWDTDHGGYFHHAGDAHAYPAAPHPPLTYRFLRTLGHDTRPVFLSEFGSGSQFNAVDEYRKFEEAGARPDLPDMALIRAMRDKLQADWERLGFTGVYPFLEDFFRDSYRQQVRQRRLDFDLVRSNPRLCGFNVTGMLDHGITGEGLWTFWREWKPGMGDVLRDGWAPLRWCLFADPWHGYAGRPITLEAVLANEDVLPPGDYPVTFRVFGPEGIAWERQTQVHIPAPAAGELGPLAMPVLREEVTLNGPAGAYTFAASLEHGGAPLGDRVSFFLTDAAAWPAMKGTVTVWGMDEAAIAWLTAQGLRCRGFSARPLRTREVILVGNPVNSTPRDWRAVQARVARGGTAVFLDPRAFARGDDSTYWLPLARKGRCYAFNDWLYHKECVAKDHPIFAGLQRRGILDNDYYDQVIPHMLFDGLDTPDDTAAAAFAVGYSCPGGYAAGLLTGSYRIEAGQIVLNTLRIPEHLGRHPAADRLLLNLIRYACALPDALQPNRKAIV